jgi:hypothetical protein
MAKMTKKAMKNRKNEEKTYFCEPKIDEFCNSGGRRKHHIFELFLARKNGIFNVKMGFWREKMSFLT